MDRSKKWKKLVNNAHTVAYEKKLGDYRIIIEARNQDNGWEIIKKYIGSGINFNESYNAQNSSELKTILKQLRNEKELTKAEIHDINRFKKKPLRVQLRRAYKTSEVEKWHFSINDDFTNIVTIHYADELEIDVVMEQQLKYVEEKILAKLYETLGVDFQETSIQQHIYYYNKKTDYYLDSPDEELDVEFVFG